MIWSDALPPSRHEGNRNIPTLVTFIGLFALIVSVLWLTSCTGVSSGPQNSSITLSVAPTKATVAASGAQEFAAIVSNTSNGAVIWSASQGTITINGLYKAPSVTTNTTATVTATSVADSTVSTTASITILPAGSISVTVSPLIASLSSGATQQFTATVQNTTNTGVSWSVSSGTISSSGLYTAPTVSTNTAATVTATSVADSTVSASVPVTIAPSGSISVSVTPSSADISSAATQQFTATVQNTSNTAVSWSASTGTISSSGLYTAPTVSTNTTATVIATSQADSSKSASASLTISASGSPLTITSVALSKATAGTAYSNPLTASGGTAPYSWTLAIGTLPTGITLQTSGSISGTTTQTGQFNFSVQVADSSSPRQTASQPLTLMVNSSGTGNAIPLSFFNADFNGGSNWPPTDGLGQPASLGGIRLWDDNEKWSQINTASGVYDWTGLDAWLSRAQSSNMDVLYTFGATPQFAATDPPPSGCLSPGTYSCSPPVDVNADGTGTDAYFSAFVTALVTHAAGRIAYYELWNEADSPGFWGGTTAQIVRMSQDAAAIIRSLDPNARILSPSAHGGTMSTWFDGYIAAGGAPTFDIVNVHMRGVPLLNATPEEFLTIYGQVETELAARDLTSLPLWDDEWGIKIGELTDPDMLEGFNSRSVILRAGVGLQRQYVYQWDSVSPYGLQGSGSGTAWDQVASWLIGHSINPCVANGTVYTCQLDYGQIVWDTAQSCSNGVCTTSSYTYPPQYAFSHDIAGNRTALSGTAVQIGYKPILLENQ